MLIEKRLLWIGHHSLIDIVISVISRFMQIPKEKTQILPWIALAVATISLAISLVSIMARNAKNSYLPRSPEVTLQRIKREGVLRVGYGGFPPYTIIDLKEANPDKRIKGFAADLVNEIACRCRPPLKVEWHIVNWETMKAELDSKKFDFIADPVYETVPRALEFNFTDPYSYFGIALALVKKDDQRFKTFADLDRSDITIAIAEGWASTEYARQHLTKPKLKIIPVGGDAYVQLDDVLMGRSDVALQDSPTVVQYANAHPTKVKILWLDKPPSIVPGGFTLRLEDTALLKFLNSSIRTMKADGTLAGLDKKWNSYGYLDNPQLIPGQGLQKYLAGQR
jgi:ABC-type amino acid transport substrate-binding protein